MKSLRLAAAIANEYLLTSQNADFDRAVVQTTRPKDTYPDKGVLGVADGGERAEVED